MDTCSNRFLKFVLALAILCGLSGCTYDLVVRAGYANPSGVYSAVEGPAAAGSGDAGAPVAAPDGGRKLGSNANYAYAVGFGANNVAWSTAYATPEISVATPTTDVATVPLLIKSQQPYAGAVTNIKPGPIVLDTGTAVSGTNNGLVQIKAGGQVAIQIGQYTASTSYGALYLTPNIVAGTNNFTFIANASSTNLNAPSGGNIYFSNGNGNATVSMTPSLVALAVPLGGNPNVGGAGYLPLQFSGQTLPNTVACGTGGTQTISAVQSAIPVFLITGGTLTSDCVIDFSTNATTGFFMPTIGTFTALNGHNLSFKNGTTTLSYSALPAHNMVIVQTGGTNVLALSP